MDLYTVKALATEGFLTLPILLLNKNHFFSSLQHAFQAERRDRFQCKLSSQHSPQAASLSSVLTQKDGRQKKNGDVVT